MLTFKALKYFNLNIFEVAFAFKLNEKLIMQYYYITVS